VLKNAETYKTQVFKVLDPTKTRVRFNSEWLEKMRPIEVAQLGAFETVAACSSARISKEVQEPSADQHP